MLQELAPGDLMQGLLAQEALTTIFTANVLQPAIDTLSKPYRLTKLMIDLLTPKLADAPEVLPPAPPPPAPPPPQPQLGVLETEVAAYDTDAMSESPPSAGGASSQSGAAVAQTGVAPADLLTPEPTSPDTAPVPAASSTSSGAPIAPGSPPVIPAPGSPTCRDYSVAVRGFEVVGDYAVYLIEMWLVVGRAGPDAPAAVTDFDVNEGLTYWSVMRRFRDFATLHGWLRQRYARRTRRLQLPPRRMGRVDRLNEQALEDRRAALDDYLQQIIDLELGSTPELCEFLRPDSTVFTAESRMRPRSRVVAAASAGGV